jgi:hypothetical protein
MNFGKPKLTREQLIVLFLLLSTACLGMQVGATVENAGWLDKVQETKIVCSEAVGVTQRHEMILCPDREHEIAIAWNSYRKNGNQHINSVSWRLPTSESGDSKVEVMPLTQVQRTCCLMDRLKLTVSIDDSFPFASQKVNAMTVQLDADGSYKTTRID